jgi:hypothetical protein
VALKNSIPMIVERLGDKDPDIRTSNVSVLQHLARYSKPLPYMEMQLIWI